MSKFSVPLVTVAAVLLLGCRPDSNGFRAGAYYSTAEPTHNHFRVVQILAVEPGIVHAAIFSNKFSVRPARIDPGTLRFGGIHDPDGPGFPHMPFRSTEFHKWQPLFLQPGTPSSEELTAYSQWRADGGTFLFGTP